MSERLTSDPGPSSSSSAAALDEQASRALAPAEVLRSPVRLEALAQSGLLAPERNEKFDRIVLLAARLLGTPVALISAVEPHRQYFTSAVGLAEPWASRRETPLSHSFCQHVVTSGDVLAVEDARTHALVSGNGAVRDLGVIAYLGAPVCAPSGDVLGSLCAIDGTPRAWNADDVALLQDLAALLGDALVLDETATTLVQVSRQLVHEEGKLAAEADALIALQNDLDRQNALLTTALDGAPLILFAFDADGTLTMSRGQALAALGLTDGEAVGSSVWEFAEGHPEATEGLQQVFEGRSATWPSTFGEQWFETTASPDGRGGGVAVSALVTERVLAERRAETQTEKLRRLVAAVAVQGAFDVQAEAVLREVTDMLGLDHGLLAWVEDGTYTCLASHAVAGDALAPGTAMPLGDTYCDLTMEAGDIVAIEHMAASEHGTHRCYEVVGLEAYVGVPVWVDGAAVGALSFASKHPAARPFTDGDLELVRFAGQWAGVFLERQTREQATQVQVERLHALAEAFSLRTLNDRSALTAVLDRLRLLLGLEVGLVSRVTPADDTYEVIACAVPDDVAMQPGDVFALGETYCSIALASGDVLAIDHMQASEHRRHPCYQAFGLEAYLGAPVYVEDGIYGTISFSSPTPRTVPFSEADKDLVLLMARWAGGLLTATLSMERQREAERMARERELELALVQRALPDAFVLADPERRIQRVNPSFSQLFGYAPDEVIGDPTLRLYADPDAFERTGRTRFNARISEQLDPYVVDYRRKDGTVFAGETVGTPVRDGEGRAIGYIGLIRDVTAREEQARELAESEARYRLLAENMSDLVCLHRADGAYEWVSPSVTGLLGYDPNELIGVDPYRLFHPDDIERIRTESHEPALEDREQAAGMTYRIRHKDGHWVWLETITQPILDEDGEVVRLQTASRDVSERRAMEDRLYHQAHHDALTGLANRTLFRARLDVAVERFHAKETGYAVLFIDLDRFKVINDTLGHSVGDQVLQEVARQLQQIVRPTDIVARFGGDEFAVLLSGLDEPQQAEQVAGRIQHVLNAPFEIDGHLCSVGASTGIVTGSASHRSADAILREADVAMYEAKRAGRGRVAAYTEGAYEAKARRLRLEMDLPRAIAGGELCLAYQPIVRLGDGALSGFEALVRWQHPDLGLLYPDAFIDLAEESGQVAAVDQWVLQEACRQMAVWQETFGGNEVLLLNVNCTGNDLLDTGYTEAVRRVSEQYGFTQGRLLLEITESLLVEDIDAVAAELRRLQEIGIQFCIDDFGTGYSSLSMLHAVPVDRVKVDRSFVAEMEERAESRALVETIVRLGDLLGKAVVAEGVETPAHLTALRAMACAYGQGYLFAPPLSVDDASALIGATQLPWSGYWT